MSQESTIYTPEAILPEGDDFTTATNPFTGETGRARKGIIAATLNNVALLNPLLLSNSDKHLSQIHAIESTIKELLPSLKAVGIFHMFTVDEWVGEGQQPGRVLAALLYLQAYPGECSPKLHLKLEHLSKSLSSSYVTTTIAHFLQTHYGS